ncbi:hypothetical protein BDV96DRAFT_651584 [Lophiotrema nucula]|uniref:MARVEL domain-containing protein n=1 Tax=Lophiotrema nucula TaxID=690887 RepID=A0A6A5YRE6_9PLEO|nr:hypothetical protein BDV96DRAFT_651584 [Lophiotrema nucula]
MDTEAGRPANVLPVPRWTLLLHGIQIILAIIILGLSAYGVRWIAYNALIYALVVCICTLGVALYIIASSLFIHKLYNGYVVFAFHIWMIIFWLVDLGLVANLARIWGTYDGYLGGYYSYYSYYYAKRDLHQFAKRDDTTYKAYYGALAAGAFFAAVQFALWVVGAIIVGIYLNKNRSVPNATHVAPPAYANNGQTIQPEPKTQQYQQQSYSVAQTPQPQYAQPAYPQQPQQSYGGQQPHAPGPYPNDPVNREATVSPVSQAYTGPTGTTSELASPQQTGGYNANANELPVTKHN